MEKSNISISLEEFIKNWDEDYIYENKKLSLFSNKITRKWSKEQKICFVKIFYHARGHFHNFLWYLGNHTNDLKVKEIILNNIAEELNYSSLSHEQMYFEFANSLEVDLSDEVINETNYLDEIRNFNKGHLLWLHRNCPDTGFAALSAYERLDNIDYINLLQIAESMGVKGKGLLFFKVHTRVEHFASTQEKLREIWKTNYSKVIESFNFISAHQIKLWHDIGRIISKL